MVSIKFVQPDKFISKLKEELKKVNEVQPPAWSKFVKSSISRVRPPQQPDFWYVRSASVLRRIYLEGPVGVERLRTYFGKRKKFGHAPPHFRRASGNILRKILQQLEKAGYIEKDKKGRKITAKGKKFLDKVAREAKNA